MLAGKIADMIAARRNRRHFHFDPIDPLVGVHVQLGDKAAPNQAYFDLLHDRAPSVRIVGWVEFFTRPNNYLCWFPQKSLDPPYVPSLYPVKNVATGSSSAAR